MPSMGRNVLIPEDLAKKIVRNSLEMVFDGDRHERCVAMFNVMNTAVPQ